MQHIGRVLSSLIECSEQRQRRLLVAGSFRGGKIGLFICMDAKQYKFDAHFFFFEFAFVRL